MRLYNPDAYVEIVLSDSAISLNNRAENGRRLAIDFEVNDNRSSNPNQGVVMIYNLSEDLRALIATDAVGIRVFAGFDEVFKLIYQGDITSVQNRKLNPGWGTQITAGDGYKAFTETVFSKAYASGTENQTIIDDIVGSMKLAAKKAADVITGKTDGDITLDGLAKDVLETVVGDAGAIWSIQDGEVHITQEDQPIDDEAILINSETGLLESPVVTEKGVNIRSVLNPDVRPGKLIKLESLGVTLNVAQGLQVERRKSYDGFYLVQSCAFVGNNYGGAFDVVMETVSYA